QIERERFATLTNHGAFLEAHPPTHEAEIHDNFSWSCPHGVERWRADCGCRTRGDRHQRWRGPLRAALDWLRDQVDLLFERRADLLLKDPWEARDDYIRVVLDRSRDTLGDYFARHRRRPLDASEQVAAIRLLEMQRQRLLMYTSCGWFFDEISGLEPVQIQKYAAMAIQYVRSLGGGALEEEFLRRLATAPRRTTRWWPISANGTRAAACPTWSARSIATSPASRTRCGTSSSRSAARSSRASRRACSSGTRPRTAGSGRRTGS